MIGKNLGYDAGTQFLQIGDYQYNIRGWLSKFNQPSTATPGGTYRDLLAFELHYNTGASSIVSGTPNLFNGNISAMAWQVLGEGKEIRAFAFTYDPMNRLTSAKYREKTSSSWNVNTSRYDVTNLIYDRNGNIKSLQRKGMTNPVADPIAYGVMDNLTYTYENSGKSNRLQRINDAGVKTAMTGVEHFVDGNTSNTDYLYDNSGNLKQDLNKGISSIVYNHLNKPTTITFSNGKKIQYIYDAAGTKLRQKVFGNGGSSTTVETDYVGPFHYEDSDGDGSSATLAIQFFAHEEGRVRRAGSDLIYETFLKDHLGNVRVMFADMNGDGWVDPNPVNGEVLQVDHFYPFGLRMAGLSLVPAVKNSYLFTGKETQDELSLGWIDFGARMYDAASSRWNGVDALGEKYVGWSPYNYAYNNPVLFTDPDGNSGVVSISVRGDGKIVLTFSSTLHVRGNVSDETIANMNRELNRYLNTQSVEYDENIVIAFQVNAVRENLDEFDPEKDNLVDIVPGENHMRVARWELERIDPEKDEADVRVWPGNNLRITQQNADGVIDPYQKEGSNTLPHEVLHAFGILDRYAGPQPDPEYEDDMMGQGKRTYLRNQEQFQGIVELAKSAQEKSQSSFSINYKSEGVINYNLSRASNKQRLRKLPSN